MSGITPILDTLLHQVLGKRVDVPLARPLPDPVKSLLGAEAPPAVRSDSRLDPRALPARESGVPAGEARPGSAPAPTSHAAPGSTRTHFSPAARTIADLLARYPAPPSAVRPPAPLMSPGEQGAPELAARLRGSLEQSGLFYESHLQGWFQGRRDATALAREPQMRVFLAARAAASAPQGEDGAGPVRGAAATPPAGPVNTPSAAGASSLAPAGAPERATPVSGQAASAGTESGAEEARRGEPRPAPALSEAQRDTLHGVLRHQLEMLATPVLRWEGDVWSGVFMALMIQLPGASSERPDHQAGEGGDEEAPAQAWRTGLTLSLPALGEVRVSLALVEDRLDLTLGAAEETARRLRAGGGRLRERLVNLGLANVRITVNEENGDGR